MGVVFWTAQGLSMLSTIILLVISLVNVKRKIILLGNIIINLLLSTSYYLLDGYSGAVCCLICIAVVSVFYFKEKIRKHIWIPILFSVAFVVFGTLTWQNFSSLIPIIGHIVLVIAFWCDDEVTIKSLIAVVAALWIIYNIVVRSYSGVVGQSLSFAFNIINVMRYRKNKNST